jgi:hypothetical protein
VSALLLLAALGGCDLQAFFLKPDGPFDPAALAPPPDYSQRASWAAHPDLADRADLAPPGAETPAEPAADVFFIHPTAWFNLEVWNDTLDDPKSLEVVDQLVLSGEASAFSGCCRVFAPRYRQSTIGAFYGDVADARASLEVAYGDVERAFDAFLEASDGRPFLIAGHSQGSMHGLRLLTRVGADPALRERLVVAYLPGFANPLASFEGLSGQLTPCEAPTQTGCVAAWDTYAEGAAARGHEPMLHWVDGALRRYEDTPRQCTNPISWRADEAATDPSAHRGAVAPVNTGNPVVMRKLLMSEAPLGVSIAALGAPRGGWLTARCEGGVLRVPDVGDLGWPETEAQPGNYHLMDYELFYLDIRENAAARVAAWRAARGP